MHYPMYTAHLAWSAAQLLLLQNWIVEPSFLITSLPLYMVRIPHEEQMMLETFKQEYTDYKNRTGLLFPKINDYLGRKNI